jgi:hypothetical protein
MKKLAFGLFIGLIAVMFGLAWLAPAQAAPLLQNTPFPTPTPGADGRILYLVQSGDTLYWLESVTGVSVEELRQLNNMGPNDVLIAGTYILLGLGGPAEATRDPGAPDQPGDGSQLTPTPTAIMDSGAICVLLYLDANGDAIRQGEEIGMGDGEVSVTERLGAYSEVKTTFISIDPIEPLCFEGILPGEYLVSIAIPEGYNRTTPLSATIELVPGDTAYLNFGMQPGAMMVDTSDEQGPNLPVGILGVTLLVVGAAAGIYAAIASRGSFSERD